MANNKRFVVKNGLQTQNILFIDSASGLLTIQMLFDSTDTLSWIGDVGQLFSITDSLTGTIFSVNDISGIPSLEVDDTGIVRIAEFEGNVLIGTDSDNGEKLLVNGTSRFDSAAEFRSTITSFSTINASQASSTATLTIANTNGAGGGTYNSGALIADFKGETDAIRLYNINTGDYWFGNSQQGNGIFMYDQTGGVVITYNGSSVLEVNSTGGMNLASGDLQIGGTSRISSAGAFTAASLSLGGHTMNDIDIGGEFNDVDDHLMTSAAINDRFAPLNSPALTGTPTAPTAAGGTNTTQIATTAFVQTELAGVSGGGSEFPVTVTATGISMQRDNHYHVSDSGQTMTLPPADAGDRLELTVRNFTNTIVARNGNKIMGLDSDITIDVKYTNSLFVFIDSSWGWHVN